MGDGIGGGEVIDFYQGVGWGTGSGYDLIVCFFFNLCFSLLFSHFLFFFK